MIVKNDFFKINHLMLINLITFDHKIDAPNKIQFFFKLFYSPKTRYNNNLTIESSKMILKKLFSKG